MIEKRNSFAWPIGSSGCHHGGGGIHERRQSIHSENNDGSERID
jgi:hypothetical protein